MVNFIPILINLCIALYVAVMYSTSPLNNSPRCGVVVDIGVTQTVTQFVAITLSRFRDGNVLN